jgi:hypothetical protein
MGYGKYRDGDIRAHGRRRITTGNRFRSGWVTINVMAGRVIGSRRSLTVGAVLSGKSELAQRDRERCDEGNELPTGSRQSHLHIILEGQKGGLS